MKAIGIDIGTTSVCGVVIDTASGAVLRSCTKNSEAFLLGCAPWEKIQSVNTILAVAIGILDDLIADDVAVIGVTGQMHGIVYVDEDGMAVSPLYTWQDERGNLPYRDTTYAKHLNSCAGYGNVTDFYNRQNGLRPAQAVTYCTIHDYFVMRLCGRKVPLIHASDAASFGCYDLAKNHFTYACDAQVVADYHIAGTYKGIPVSVAIGDNQASVFSTLVDENSILLNVGTGSQVSIVSDTPITGENIEVRPYFEGKYLVVGSALCGGRAYSLLKDFYADVLGYVSATDTDQVYQIMERMLAQTDTSSLTVDTRFAGTRSDADQYGCIGGITTENFTPSQLTRGVLEGMATELLTMYRQMGVNRGGIVGSGNGLRKNPTLVRIFEQTFNAPMQTPAHLEEAAFGAALFGLIACGVFQNAVEAHQLVAYTNL